MPGEVTSSLANILDSELLKLEAVVAALNEKQDGRSVNLEGFRKEIIGRFAEVGFVVQPVIYETDQEGLWWFDVNIVDRTEPKPFDYDRMVEEVTSDILGFGEKGFIKSGPPPTES